MSTKIVWNGDLSSIKSFFKYLVAVWKMENINEKEYKTKDLYKDYVEFCKNVDLDYYSVEAFGKTLTSLGVETKVVWGDQYHASFRTRILTLNSMSQIIIGYEEPFFATSQIVPLQGKMYLMTVKLKEVTIPKDEEPFAEFTNIINKNNFNDYVGQQPNSNNQQPISDDAGGNSCEA